MADLKEKGIALLSSTSSVDVHGTSKTILYTVPTGKTAYITHVIVRDPSDSMAGGSDYDFGTGANADTWNTAVDLSGLTTADTDYAVITADTPASESAAGSEFGIKATTGTTADPCTATIDVFGYLV